MTRRTSRPSLAQTGAPNQPELRVPAVILAGGLATRMGGGDKALHPFGKATLLDAVLARLCCQTDRIAINANGDPARFARFGLPVIADSVAGFPGPLGGVLAAMDWAAPGSHVLTVPTDAPFLPLDLASRLARALIGAASETISCAHSAGIRHPVIAIWPTCLRDALESALRVEDVRKVNAFIARYPSVAVDFESAGGDPFLNLNTPAAVIAAARLERDPG